MKIAIDLRPVQIGHEYRGIGAYLKNMLSFFPFDDENNTFIFLRYHTSNPLDTLGLEVNNYEEVVIKEIPKASTKPGKIWVRFRRKIQPQYIKLRQHKPDVFLQPDYLLGLPYGRKIKKFVVMYDLIPLVLKNEYMNSWQELLFKPGLGKRNRVKVMITAWLHGRLYKKGVKTVKRADKILSISRATENDLVKILGINRKKIKTIHLAPALDKTNEIIKQPSRLKNISSPFLLFIGGVDQRRRVSELIYAFNFLNARGDKFDLALGGKELGEINLIPNVGARNAIRKSSYSKQIHAFGYLSEEEKIWLLQNAFAFVYPTIYEGFGLPVLEAMEYGCPVLTGNNSSLPEITGDSAILLDELTALNIYKAIHGLIDNPGLRNKLADLGIKQSKKFSWESCAKKTFKEITG